MLIHAFGAPAATHPTGRPLHHDPKQRSVKRTAEHCDVTETKSETRKTEQKGGTYYSMCTESNRTSRPFHRTGVLSARPKS
eukprot:SAG31_NODE_6589_length_1961_cov_1.373255_3_plen_80_part_01